MKKKCKTRTILSLILSLALVLGMCTTSYATEEIPEDGTEEEAVVETTAEDTLTEEPEETGDTTEDIAEEAAEVFTDDVPEEEEYGVEALSAEVTEDGEEEEDSEIQVFASTEEEQTLKVAQKAEGTIGDDVSFTYHLYKITEAAETITKMGDITGSEPGASLEYVIVETDTGEEVSTETTDGNGAFAIHVGETAEFTLEAETSWYVTQDTPDAYPLVSVGSDGEYAEVVDSTNGVLYYGQIEPEPAAPVINVSVTTNLTDNEKTYDGGSVTLTAEATVTPDTATVSYQWYKDGVEINGATGSTYTLDGNASDSGTYKCVVTAEDDGLNATAEAEVTVTINKADQDISYGQSTVTKIDYDGDFTNLLTQTTVVGQITYASSDETVATVDPDTGEVTIVGPGYTTITATAAETDNYKEASASYVLTVNSDEVEWEIDVNHDQVTWDEEHEEWVDDLTYTGEPMELEMAITLTEEEQEELVGITYQWYRYNDDTQDFDEIEGATEQTYMLEDDDVNAGDYIYMCKAVVTYTNGYEHIVYGPIEVIIEKVAQDISYAVTEIKKTELDEPFTNELTKTTVSEEEGAGITYESSDETIATVDENGEVTIIGPGEVTITATAAETANYAEATASYTLTVLEQPVINGLTITSGLTDNNVKTYDGDEVALTAVADYTPDTATITYQWYMKNDAGEYTKLEGADEETLTLDGNVSDTGTYGCEVTVTNEGLTTSDHAEITITINVAGQDISYEKTEIQKTTAAGAFTNPLTKTFVDPNGQITYASSDETVATVNAETGVVTIVGVGTATITATAAATENCTEATTSYTLTVENAETWNSVQYAVKLWGICTDTYSYDEGETTSVASLTFGPATGANHLNNYVECSSDTCIHKLSWDEIIAYCNQYQGNSAMLTSLFGSCLENGCTKAVELTPNGTLFNLTAVNNALAQGYTGDGVSTLFYLLNGTGSTSYTYGADWNQSYTGYSGSDPANIYSRSRVRATLIGDSTDAKEWVANDYNDYYGVDTMCNESNCLLTCFPVELQSAVVPRTTLNSGNAAAGPSMRADSKTTYDKLFLFSLKEIGISSRYDDGGGSDYGVNPNASDWVVYEFGGTAATTSSSRSWWSRSRSSTDFYSAEYVSPTTGGNVSSNVNGNYGLSPGFCIK